jgi:hypothetical protein
MSKFYVDPNPDGYIDSTAEFYRLPDERFRSGHKVLIREITGTDGIVAAHTDRRLFFPKSIITLVPNKEGYDTAYLSGLLNSEALSFYFLVAGEKSSQSLFPRLSITSLKHLPIRPGMTQVPDEIVVQTLDDYNVADPFREDILESTSTKPVTAEFISRLVEEISTMKQEQVGININLFDYLGDFDHHTTLGEHRAYQPATGVKNTILTQTAEGHPDLKLESVRVERAGTKIVVEAIAKYKPDDEGAHETDRWGYTSTNPIAIVEFIGLDEIEKELIAEFVETVVNEADDGTAGFRRKVTKTNSLVDRLKSLHLPDPDDVSEDFEQYLNRKRRTEELDNRIECLTEIVNNLVYDMFDLSDEEQAIVIATIDDE